MALAERRHVDTAVGCLERRAVEHDLSQIDRLRIRYGVGAQQCLVGTLRCCAIGLVTVRAIAGKDLPPIREVGIALSGARDSGLPAA
jgi:hypothetical protein